LNLLKISYGFQSSSLSQLPPPAYSLSRRPPEINSESMNENEFSAFADNLPSYNQLSQNIDNLPPNYYNISIVPEGAILNYSDVLPVAKLSEAEIERNKNGIISLDPLLNNNPDELWRYFMTYLTEKPNVVVVVHGYHTESYIAYEQYRDANGNFSTRPVHRSKQVDDFNFTVDITPYINAKWSRVVVRANGTDNEDSITLRDCLEQYTRSTKKIKQLTLEKQIDGWRLQDVKDNIKVLLRQTGYRHHITVTFPLTNYKIVARGSNKISKFANNTCARLTCVLTCLWIVFLPVYLCMRSRVLLLSFNQVRSTIYGCNPNAKCGCSQFNATLTRIIGGESVKLSTWGFAVSIRVGGSHFCGGTILSDKLIITAAHCVAAFPSISRVSIAAGSNYLTIPNQVRSISTATMHEEYDPSQFLNDIAILKLSSSLDLTDSEVSKICLPNISSSYLSLNEYPPPDLDVVAIGWGVLFYHSVNMSNTLQQVALRTISKSNYYCNGTLYNPKYQFCAGNLTGGKDTCQGDSGGPLLLFTNNQWQLVGITSYGVGCGNVDRPGIYTRVAYYLDWIKLNGCQSSIDISAKKYFYCLVLFIMLFIRLPMTS
ncbi:unnamed protein product, partial [Didymodactylos carnosus]